MTDPSNMDALTAATPQDAPDMRRKKSRSKETREEGQRFHKLKEDCPVTPLGVQGMSLWVLDNLNQLQSIKPRELGKGELALLFGGEDYLLEEYPMMSLVEGTGKNKIPPRFEPNGKFDQNAVQQALIADCLLKGIFKPEGKVMGRGAHRGRDDDGQLYLHMGTKVMVSRTLDWRGTPRVEVEVLKAGAIDGKYFPADDPLPPPAPVGEVSTTKEAEDLQRLFAKWFFVEPGPAELLLLGMVGQLFICGALNWRSHVWLAGPTASGKSSLQKLVRALLGEWVLSTEDASEAAIRQLLGNDTLGVMIDEAEAADNPERQRAMMNLAKKSSSGGKIMRGGADHKGQEFTARSAFLFSSVLHTPMLGEDRNRFAILDMRQVPANIEPFEIGPHLSGWRAIGRKMHRRMIEQWPRFESTLASYKREIHSHGFEGRWQDTYGTLLACADMLLYDAAPQSRMPERGDVLTEKDWVRKILPLMTRGKVEARSDDERVIAYLLSLTLPGSHGASPETIGQWVIRAMSPRSSDDGEEATHNAINETARSRLKSVGLRVVKLDENRDGPPKLAGEPIINEWDGAYLAVAFATCRPLNELFRNTEWFNGGWLQSMGKIEGARKGLKMRFSGPNADNAIAIPLSALKERE